MDPNPTRNLLSPSITGIASESDLNPDSDLAVIRSLSMSANVANSIKEEVNYSIRLSVNDTSPEPQPLPELVHDGEPQIPANIDIESSSCSHILPREENGIVIGFVLSKWDNIIGPQTVHVWLEENSEGLNNHKTSSCYHKENVMLMKAIKYVTGHTVHYLSVTAAASRNPEHGAARLSKFNEKSTSLYIVPDLNIVAHSIVFTVQNLTSTMPYSVALIVNFESYKYYLNVHRICQLWLRRLGDQVYQQIVSCYQSKKEFETNDQVNRWVLEFNKMIFSLTPHHLGIVPLIQECNKATLSLPCMERALVSHLQTSGCSVVMGTSHIEVNALIAFLALFLDRRELYFCRFVGLLPKYSFHMGLFLQGLILDEYGCRQWCAEELAATPYQVTAIDLTRGGSVDAVKQSTSRHPEFNSRHLSMFNTVKSSNTVLVKTLLADLGTLPTDRWEQMVKLFMEKIKTLARALLSFEEKMRVGDHLGLKNVELQNHLRLHMHLQEDDFLIVRCMANKIQSGNSF